MSDEKQKLHFTVPQVQELRKLLEGELLIKLREFETRTGMTVERVELDSTIVGMRSDRISQLQGVHLVVQL